MPSSNTPPSPSIASTQIEAETRHDVLAFTTAVAESVERAGSSEARWLHYGLTSTDVVDTAQALALTQASAAHPRRHRETP